MFWRMGVVYIGISWILRSCVLEDGGCLHWYFMDIEKLCSGGWGLFTLVFHGYRMGVVYIGIT